MDTTGQEGRAAAHEPSLVRIEVEADEHDAALICELADHLRGESTSAQAVRAALEHALVEHAPKDAFEAFGSDLPDEAFSGVFDQPRESGWRRVDL